MARFEADAQRVDPYKNFKFRVKWDGRYVAGVSRVSAPARTTQVVTHRQGGDPHTPRMSPGQTDFEPITLERGLTHDAAFEQWANKVWDYEGSAKLGEETSLQDFRKDIVIDMFNDAGQVVMSYHVYRCWVSEWTAMPELDGSGNGVAMESMTLQHEGWDRDVGVTAPAKPSFTDPQP